MDTRQFDVDTQAVESPVPAMPTNDSCVLHRIAEVRIQQSLSTRLLAKRLGTTPKEIDQQMSPCCDLLLSQLYKYQAALDVPVAELLIAPGKTLSPPIDRRARLVRLMKSVRSLQQLADSDPMRMLAEQMAEQLIEIMPELVDVGSWPVVGQRRSLDDVSALEERALPESVFDKSRLPMPDFD